LSQNGRGGSWTAVKCPFHYPQNRNRARKPERPILFGHPELAKDLTAGQLALGHYSPFSKLTAPPGEPPVPTTCRLKRTSRPPREILRKLRMTTLGAPFSLLRPICKLEGNGKESPPLSKRLGLRIYPKRFLRPSVRRFGGNQASPQSYKTLARPQRATASPLRMVSRPFQVEVRRSDPELAKDLTAGQPALCHPSPFSKLTAPPDEPSTPNTCRLKRTSQSPREILRRLRMTTFGAPFSLLRPICKLAGYGKSSGPPSFV